MCLNPFYDCLFTPESLEPTVLSEKKKRVLGRVLRYIPEDFMGFMEEIEINDNIHLGRAHYSGGLSRAEPEADSANASTASCVR